MKPQELRELSVTELEDRIAEAEMQYRRYKFQNTITSLENPNLIRITRRSIARMKTILAEKLTADSSAEA